MVGLSQGLSHWQQTFRWYAACMGGGYSPAMWWGYAIGGSVFRGGIRAASLQAAPGNVTLTEESETMRSIPAFFWLRAAFFIGAVLIL